ncbi:unnamed protein product [Tetraodon nigroviridis]|uniref:Chromosome 3 SCAF14593, whole genome shotgun sequence n=1 Tax=Tetraodon nigroviridis TaxID=99883 RepID=Q4SGP1_TETNG|nr:unnamed protein product [Tetraodon nigroviridis]
MTPGTLVEPCPAVLGQQGQLFDDCHDSASVNQQMLLSQQLAPQQQLRLDLLTCSSLHRRHGHRSSSGSEIIFVSVCMDSVTPAIPERHL